MKRFKGPEIKLSKVRLPQFLVDLYRDLDDRHLLPVVALLLIAIVAIPFALSDSGSPETKPEFPTAAPGASASATSAKESKLVVVHEDPRLRSYKRRLGHLESKDPFGPENKGGEGSEAATATESITEVEASQSSESSSSSESSGGASSETGTPKSTITYFTYGIDVRVTPVSSNGKPSKAQPTVREELPTLVMLPSRETPALTYVGPSRDGKKAIMLISDEVVGLFGDSKCVAGSQTCQLLALEPGLPETVVYGPKARTYKIELLKIKVIYSDHLERAPIGKPKKSKNSG